MVPMSLVMVMMFGSFGVCAFIYFVHRPDNLIFSFKFLMMGGAAGIMLFMIGLQVAQVHSVLVSWIMFALAVVWIVNTFRLLQRARAVMREEARKENELRMRQRH